MNAEKLSFPRPGFPFRDLGPDAFPEDYSREVSDVCGDGRCATFSEVAQAIEAGRKAFHRRLTDMWEKIQKRHSPTRDDKG